MLRWLPCLAFATAAACFVDGGGPSAGGSTTSGASADPTTGIDTTASPASTGVDDSASGTDPVTTTLTTGAPPLPCGNGIVDPGETCDDSNQNDGDGCSSTCALETPTKLYTFVTLGTFNGNIGGLANADSKCASEASNHGLPGVYLAWLSDANGGPAQRFTSHDLPIVLPGEAEPVVAVGTAGLGSGQLTHAIDRGPDGVPLPLGQVCEAANLVWTGTLPDGTPHGDRCQDYTNADAATAGHAGAGGAIDPAWTDACSITCDQSLRLYCFQQAPQ